MVGLASDRGGLTRMHDIIDFNMCVQCAKFLYNIIFK